MRHLSSRLIPALAGALAVAGLGWFPGAAEAQRYYGTPYFQRGPVTHRAEIQQAAEIAEAFLAQSRIPGLQVSVGIDGLIVWSEGFGLADVEQGVPVTRQTRFQNGSIGKSMTVAGASKLVEAGKLDWDADARKYVPFFPQKQWPFTVRQLANHTSGIRHYKPLGEGEEFFILEEYNSIRDGLKIFQDDPLMHAPGSRYLYSSYALNLLGVVLEEASGKDYIPYMLENVFEPLGMIDTEAARWYDIMPRRARLYEIPTMGAENSYKVGFAGGGTHVGDDRLINAPFADVSYKVAAGGWLTTCDDLVRFASAHLEPGFLKAESLQQIFTSYKTTSGEDIGYGLGWQILHDEKGRLVYAHSGGPVGSTGYLLVYPEEKVVVAAMVNITSGRLGEVSRQIAEVFLDGATRRN